MTAASHARTFLSGISDATKGATALLTKSHAQTRHFLRTGSLTDNVVPAATIARHTLRHRINALLLPRLDAFTQHDQLIVRCITYNVGEAAPPPAATLCEWLFPPPGHPAADADVIAVALQEMDMSAAAMVKEQTEKGAAWFRAVDAAVAAGRAAVPDAAAAAAVAVAGAVVGSFSNGSGSGIGFGGASSPCGTDSVLGDVPTTRTSPYLRVALEQVVGVALMVFVRADLQPMMRHIHTQIVKCGKGGVLGNKAGVGVRFDLHGKAFLVVASHLVPHTKNFSGRNANFHTIVAGLRALAVALPPGAGDVIDMYTPTRADRSEVERAVAGLAEGGGGGGGGGGGAGGGEGAVDGESSAHAVAVAEGGAGLRDAAAVTEAVLGAYDYVFWAGDLNYRIDEATLTIEASRALARPAVEAFVRLESERRAAGGGIGGTGGMFGVERVASMSSGTGGCSPSANGGGGAGGVLGMWSDAIGSSASADVPPWLRGDADGSVGRAVISTSGGVGWAESVREGVALDAEALARVRRLVAADQLYRLLSGRPAASGGASESVPSSPTVAGRPAAAATFGGGGESEVSASTTAFNVAVPPACSCGESRREAWHGFVEPPILFPPSYKYDPGTSTFDTSAKGRAPAYCDRVLFRVNARCAPVGASEPAAGTTGFPATATAGDGGRFATGSNSGSAISGGCGHTAAATSNAVRPLTYHMLDYPGSDHRPVVAAFAVAVLRGLTGPFRTALAAAVVAAQYAAESTEVSHTAAADAAEQSVLMGSGRDAPDVEPALNYADPNVFALSL